MCNPKEKGIVDTHTSKGCSKYVMYDDNICVLTR